jgi:hypothetical protein
MSKGPFSQLYPLSKGALLRSYNNRPINEQTTWVDCLDNSSDNALLERNEFCKTITCCLAMFITIMMFYPVVIDSIAYPT